MNTPPQLPDQPQETTENNLPAPLASGFAGTLEAVLKNPAGLLHAMTGHDRKHTGLHLLVITIICLASFGMVLGSFAGAEQWWASPAKVVTGMIFSALLCLPSLYVFGCLSGLNMRPAATVSSLLAMLALGGLILVGFAPVAWIFAQSTTSVVFVGLLVLFIWIISMRFAFGLLKQAAQFMGVKSMEHIKVWMIVFTIVTLQMSTTLRPILGRSDNLLPTERKFFVEHWWSNLAEGVHAPVNGQR
jgi:hypothetical protein